jgi:prepilin-type N-terminal cleavage/methylation domain-containing protein
MVTRNQDRNGYSLMELVIAMALASIVISNVYFFWRYMDRHISVHSENASLQKETDRLIHQITSAVRKASSILYYDYKSITLLGETDEDTISYSFSQDTLYKNKVPLTILTRKAYVKNFEIKNLSDDPNNASAFILLEFNLTLRNQSGYESEAKLVVKIKQPVQQSDPTFGW